MYKIATSFPDPEEQDVPLPESLSSREASLDELRLSCFVSSLELSQNYSPSMMITARADLKSLTRIAISRIIFFSSSCSSLRSKFSSIRLSSRSLCYIKWSSLFLSLSWPDDPLTSILSTRSLICSWSCSRSLTCSRSSLRSSELWSPDPEWLVSLESCQDRGELEGGRNWL